MSKTIPQSTYASSVSFTEEDLNLFNSSLAREVDQAFTPIKRSQLGMGSSTVIKKPDPKTSLLQDLYLSSESSSEDEMPMPPPKKKPKKLMPKKSPSPKTPLRNRQCHVCFEWRTESSIDRHIERCLNLKLHQVRGPKKKTGNFRTFIKKEWWVRILMKQNIF